MPKKGDGLQTGMSKTESDILEKYIQYRKTISGTSERTQKKQRHVGIKLIDALHSVGGKLDTATFEQFAAVPANLTAGTGKDKRPITKNSRQTFVATLKAIVKYIEKSRKIKGDRTLFEEIRGGTPTQQNKDILTIEQWNKILNAPMSAKERAYIAMLYDGYHRPGEPFILRWSDLRTGKEGYVEYTITYKTGKSRDIIQKPETTAILMVWGRECGHTIGDDAYIFPPDDGERYKSNSMANNLIKSVKKYTGIKKLTPGSIRNTSISHDVQAGFPTTYICLRAWGEPHNDMINIYTQADSGRLQRDQQDKINGKKTPITITQTKPRSVTSLEICPKCGQQNPMSSEFCPHCGANMTTGTGGKVSDEEYNKLKEEVANLYEMMKKLTTSKINNEGIQMGGLTFERQAESAPIKRAGYVKGEENIIIRK